MLTARGDRESRVLFYEMPQGPVRPDTYRLPTTVSLGDIVVKFKILVVFILTLRQAPVLSLDQ